MEPEYTPKFEPRLKTVRFDTTLPYNCIYYVTGSQKKRHTIFLDPRNIHEILTLQDFPFYTQIITGNNLNDPERLFTSFSHDPFYMDMQEEIKSTLREIFPKSEEGCFVVRLLPYREQVKDNSIDTFLVGELTEPYGASSYLREFAIKAARLNFERMTGNTYPNLRYLIGFFKDRDWINEIKSLYRPQRPDYWDSPNTKAARLLGNEEIKEMRKKIANNYKRQFKYFSTPDVLTSDDITFRQVIDAAFSDKDDIDKLNHLCPIQIRDYDKSYDIFICPKDREPIRCDFSRGFAAKALYIFFLRHPEGFHLSDFDEKKHVLELAKIYKMLKGGVDETVFEKAKVIATAGTRSQKGSRAENLNDIKSWFKEHFINKLANDYAVEAIDFSLTLYGINIPKEMIDLGIFGFPFNPNV